MEAQVRGISSYFKGIASFEQGIANADVDFIKRRKVNDDVRKAMIAMTSLLTTQLVEETIELVAKIAEESNPIAAIFTGVDAQEIRDQVTKVADAAPQLAHGISRVANLNGLTTDTIAISADLKDIGDQITNLKTLVKNIKNNQVDEIDEDAEIFISEYAGYTPRVDRHRMAQNIAKWGAFKESTCNLLNGVERIGASVGKGVANGFLLCENLEATIVEFDALRENIIYYQFELVYSLARVVRGNVAKKLADSIQQKQNDMFKADQLLAGFLMTQIFIQSQAWLYCDKLKYQNEGQRVHHVHQN